MKNQFSFRRFGLLFRKHASEQYKSYLMALAVLAGVLTLILGMLTYVWGVKLDAKLQSLFFMLFLLGAGTVFTSTVFSNLGNPKKAIAFLTLPASSLEKFLVGWVFSFPAFLLAYIPTFYLIAAVVIGAVGDGSGEAEMFSLFGENSNLPQMLLMYAFLNAVALVGGIFFQKGQFIKTAFLLFVFFFVLLLLNKLLLQALLGHDIQSAIPFGGVKLLEDRQLFTIGLQGEDSPLQWVASIGLVVMLWAAAYFKLKEKQV
ncbi:hypothetical protein [Pontibacter roseus]|uniref:hypothetical protein n=1 Tax=Pontibacter roseus TaxID=336989 RepID=UPI0003710980|nr:hypothetical protein [Pontibacter roseus]